MKERLRTEGIDYRRFRDNLRDQLMVERIREREVPARIRITDTDIDNYLEKRRESARENAQLNIAQVLVIVPEGASPAVVAEKRARAEAALARIKAGEPFEAVAKQVSEDAYKDKGGELGLRPASKLPDAFVAQVKGLAPGAVSPELMRSGAGFHVLKLLDRQDGSGGTVVQTHARHVLLRTSPQLTAELATRRLAEFKRSIESGKTSFEAVARDNSEDGSSANGGDLGWVSPGGFVPEFEEAMNGWR
jgi:peptidyl-prolyl cis-trans isomerase SurA